MTRYFFSAPHAPSASRQCCSLPPPPAPLRHPPQAAAEPELQAVFSELFDSSQGCEIYLRRPVRYGLKVPAAAAASTTAAGDAASTVLVWGQVVEAVRAQEQTVIGLLKADGSLLMAPDMLSEVHLVIGDRLVVISDSAVAGGA